METARDVTVAACILLPEIVPRVGAEGEEGNAVAVPQGAFAPVTEAVAHGDGCGDGLG